MYIFCICMYKAVKDFLSKFWVEERQGKNYLLTFRGVYDVLLSENKYKFCVMWFSFHTKRETLHMCICAYVHLYQQGKVVREQVCYSLLHHDEGSKRTKAEQEEWLETFSRRKDVHVQSIKMLIILLSTVLASLLKGWKMFFPPHSARKGHVITDYLARSLSKVVSVCVTGKHRCIPHQLCMSNPAHDLPMRNTSVNWVVGKITITVLETIQNNKESPSK